MKAGPGESDGEDEARVHGGHFDGEAGAGMVAF